MRWSGRRFRCCTRYYEGGSDWLGDVLRSRFSVDLQMPKIRLRIGVGVRLDFKLYLEEYHLERPDPSVRSSVRGDRVMGDDAKAGMSGALKAKGGAGARV
jgi:hypothetical protein